MKYTALKGTKDVLPGRKPSLAVAGIQYPFLTSLYGFREIRTPVIEHTELFLRGRRRYDGHCTEGNLYL